MKKIKQFFEDPIKILKALFNGADILEKWSSDFNKGYPIDPEDKSKGYEPMLTNARRVILILDTIVSNTVAIGGYKENVNFQALDLEKRFGKENIIRENLPNNYKMGITDERSLQLYRKAKKEGFRTQEEASNGNRWFFFNPVIHGGLITAFSSLFWKVKPETVA